MKVNELLQEDYWDRVRSTADTVARMVGATANKADVMAAIHKVAVKQDHITQANVSAILNRQHDKIIPNGVPDYNGSSQMKKEFVGDVISALQGKIKIVDTRNSDRPTSHLSNAQIWSKVEHAISMAFPDGDPIDHLYDWMRGNRITIDDIDRAVAWHTGSEQVKGAYGQYLSDMWDDMAGDAVHDAEHGSEPNTAFVDADRGLDIHSLHAEPDSLDDRGKKKKPVAKPNPWR